MEPAPVIVGVEVIEGREMVAVLGGELAGEGPLNPDGSAFADTRGCRWAVGWLGRVIPQRFKHSSVPKAMLSGI